MKYLTIRNKIWDVTIGLVIAAFASQAYAQGCTNDPSQAGRADFSALDV